MTDDIEKLYGKKVKTVYINLCHGTRRIVCIVFTDKSKKNIMYGKLLLQIKYNRLLLDDETCDHIDGDPLNDDIDNLQILSRSENAKKGPKHEIKIRNAKIISEKLKDVPNINVQGDKNGLSKLSNSQVMEIREKQKNHVRGQDSKIAKEYNVSRSTIKAIRLNYYWNYV